MNNPIKGDVDKEGKPLGNVNLGYQTDNFIRFWLTRMFPGGVNMLFNCWSTETSVRQEDVLNLTLICPSETPAISGKYIGNIPIWNLFDEDGTRMEKV